MRRRCIDVAQIGFVMRLVPGLRIWPLIGLGLSLGSEGSNWTIDGRPAVEHAEQ